MSNVLRGIIAGSMFLLMLGIIAAIWSSDGPFKAGAALVCAGFAGGEILLLVYAIENDDFIAGLAIPVVAVIGLAVAYFTEPPLGLTLGVSLVVAIFAIVVIQQGD